MKTDLLEISRSTIIQHHHSIYTQLFIPHIVVTKNLQQWIVAYICSTTQRLNGESQCVLQGFGQEFLS